MTLSYQQEERLLNIIERAVVALEHIAQSLDPDHHTVTIKTDAGPIDVVNYR